MFVPEDPLAPLRPAFAEAWHAQTLALAHSMVDSGRFSPAQWAEALGKALRQAEVHGNPDTEETYYLAALAALEELCATEAGISRRTQQHRKSDWRTAYRQTPHGKPVTLQAVDRVLPHQDR